MPGSHACDAGNPSVRGRDFQASVIGERVVGRLGTEPSLVALHPWESGIVASQRGSRGFDASPTCDAGRQGSYVVRGPRVPMPVTEAIRLHPARRAARPSMREGVTMTASTSALPCGSKRRG